MIKLLYPFKKLIAIVLILFFIANIAIGLACSISRFVMENLITADCSDTCNSKTPHHQVSADPEPSPKPILGTNQAYLTGDSDCCTEGVGGFYSITKTLHSERTIKFLSIVNDLPFIKFTSPNFSILGTYKIYYIDEGPPFVRTKLHIDHQLFLI
ncbi:hypothetical protein [Solitalea canadensis]|uniref:Uncharacterized protein n=1 Tax=Solitalea canadensis (strain ATCC 29591 / DSM 3403 / JCM 21819 / LMG 8368 / NBRC 15130 / NCIMB 12057 / USAM 9D) TaxID=929556 RepID=H8KVU5_SOLCM|nr:hypothetical protein [Solitalea canadensis]AFD06718.1 hypothetical protein Solca_1652 [Solitalea canadensis DSM 3403]